MKLASGMLPLPVSTNRANVFKTYEYAKDAMSAHSQHRSSTGTDEHAEKQHRRNRHCARRRSALQGRTGAVSARDAPPVSLSLSLSRAPSLSLPTPKEPVNFGLEFIKPWRQRQTLTHRPTDPPTHSRRHAGTQALTHSLTRTHMHSVLISASKGYEPARSCRAAACASPPSRQYPGSSHGRSRPGQCGCRRRCT